MKRLLLGAGLLGASGRAAEQAAQPLPTERYTRTAIVLHWTIAALVVAMISLGQIMTEVPRQTSLRGALFNVHKSLGLLVLGLVVLRLAWRIAHRPPALPVEIPAWNRQLAGLTHGAFYVLLLAQPLLGYFASVFGKYGVKFFGIALPAWGSDNPAVREPFLAAHYLVADLLVGLIALHLAGVLWHRFAGRPALWRRMW
ncbi:MAG: cytochrome b [Sphingomonas bacterium]|nr:cytochrome b [Sphingomonas bacterium]